MGSGELDGDLLSSIDGSIHSGSGWATTESVAWLVVGLKGGGCERSSLVDIGWD